MSYKNHLDWHADMQTHTPRTGESQRDPVATSGNAYHPRMACACLRPFHCSTRARASLEQRREDGLPSVTGQGLEHVDELLGTELGPLIGSEARTELLHL